MRPDARAIVFDLDDTLFQTRRYTYSAHAAVAAHLSRRAGLNPARTAAILRGAFDRDGGPGHEIDFLLSSCGLPSAWLPELVTVARTHAPLLRLPLVASRALAALRPSWSIGILTNGIPAVQAAKVRAMALAARTDAVVYATEHGSGIGKPEREPFLEVSRRLGVAPARTVFVGDDEVRDIAGAAAVGMRTVRLTAWTGRLVPEPPTAADAVLDSFEALPRMADALLRKAAGHAA
jgi:putative hydrolase of the HAD superfamily